MPSTCAVDGASSETYGMAIDHVDAWRLEGGARRVVYLPGISWTSAIIQGFVRRSALPPAVRRSAANETQLVSRAPRSIGPAQHLAELAGDRPQALSAVRDVGQVAANDCHQGLRQQNRLLDGDG